MATEWPRLRCINFSGGWTPHNIADVACRDCLPRQDALHCSACDKHLGRRNVHWTHRGSTFCGQCAPHEALPASFAAAKRMAQ